MTLSPENAAPLLTDEDVLARVDAIVGPARQDGCVWLMLVDGDRRQAPVVVPLEDTPRRPDPHLVQGLRDVLAHFADGPLDTAGGRGSCLFVLERLGPPGVRADDEEWADALGGAAVDAGLDTLGVYSSTPTGIRRLR
ncbi:hypothetical protein [Actinomycetospora straminea]|uniref:Type III secretion system (T3SS) SseB-like protein n=1 Tax=Actinomycetospora straminea TaxID=663607 RepID=A0ABP9DX91_9PSEU|nr:hypothetical protein [Actinomycetospora straminea]MDD7936247.1 hypothetical protein [Actinomycetospora straminea]